MHLGTIRYFFERASEFLEILYEKFVDQNWIVRETVMEGILQIAEAFPEKSVGFFEAFVSKVGCDKWPVREAVSRGIGKKSRRFIPERQIKPLRYCPRCLQMKTGSFAEHLSKAFQKL